MKTTIRLLLTISISTLVTLAVALPMASAQDELVIYPDGESTSIQAECGDGTVDIFYQPSNGDDVSRSWAIYGPDGTDFQAPRLAVPGMRHTVSAVDGIRVEYILTQNGPLATYVVNAAICAPPPPTTSTTAPETTTTTTPATTTTVPPTTSSSTTTTSTTAPPTSTSSTTVVTTTTTPAPCVGVITDVGECEHPATGFGHRLLAVAAVAMVACGIAVLVFRALRRV